jgi:hypothetical protein
VDDYSAKMEADRAARIKAGQEALLDSQIWIRPARGGKWVQEYLNFERTPRANWRLVTVREARALGVYV